MKTDGRGNCVECGRLVVPNEDDLTKALLVLYNVGYTHVCVEGNGIILLSPEEGDIAARLQKALDFLRS